MIPDEGSDSAADSNSGDTNPGDTNPGEGPAPAEEALSAAREALGRMRRVAKEQGFRPGPGSGRPARKRPRADKAGGSSSRGRDPHLLGDQVERLLAERGWSSDVQVGSVVGRWAQIVGATVAEHVTPVAFEGTTLTVRADSTAWATQMRLLASSVLTQIEAEVGADLVSEIVVHGPSGPTWRKGPLSSGGRGPRDTYG